MTSMIGSAPGGGGDRAASRDRTEGELARVLMYRADGAPGETAVRQKLAARIERRSRHQRIASLIAVVAAVVLIAGGIGVKQTLFANENGIDTASSASNDPPAVVHVPTVPLPEDTQLVSFELQPVMSPVSATAPDGLTGMGWGSTPGQLVVAFEPDQPSTGTVPGEASAGDEFRATEAGYVISASKEMSLPATLGTADSGAGQSDEPRMSTRHVSVGGHDAILMTPTGAPASGTASPSGGLVVWQLSSGEWIHVWVDGGRTPDANTGPLLSFAASIREKPKTLNRTIGIGLTVSGFTHVSSFNVSPISGMSGGTLSLCPAGESSPVDSSASSGSEPGGDGSIPPGTEGDASTTPRAAPGTNTQTPGDLTNRCLSITVANGEEAAKMLAGELSGQNVTVGEMNVTVDSASQMAAVDLGRQLHAILRGPVSTHLSQQDLAALAASVRIAPDVTVTPFQGLP